MRSLSTLVTLLTLSATALAGSSCIAFDADFNLLLFGANGGAKDYNAGPQSSWASGSASEITANGRPPFNGKNVKCYLAQFFNVIYVLGADNANPADIYIYDAKAKSWSHQAITAGKFDPSNFQAILDHDTNVFYALSGGELYSLNMESLTAAQSSAISWTDQEAAGITTTNYDPVMAIAQNHIFFFGVPGVAPGSAPIFVIHFAFWQPGAQPFGAPFPDSHGQATSYFLDSGVQQEIAFIPDDGSNTYIVNVETNTTQTVTGPSIKDSAATYFASNSALVQLASSGAVSFLPYSASDKNANSNAKWATVNNLASVAPPSSGSSSSGGSSAGSSGSPSGSAGSIGSPSQSAGSPAKPSGSTTGTGGAASPSNSGQSGASSSHNVAWGSGTVLGLIAVVLSLL